MFGGRALASSSSVSGVTSTLSNLAAGNTTESGFCGIPQCGPETAERMQIVTRDGVAHPLRVWAAGPAAPTVIYLHGIEGHSRWFENTALALNKAGIAVWAPDRRGAGESSQPSGDIASYRRFVDDIIEVIQEIAHRQPNSPIFLLGNCWGGKVAVTLTGNMAHPAIPAIKGLVLTCPAVATQVDVSLVTKLKIGLSYLTGGRHYFDIPLRPEHFTEYSPFLAYISDDSRRLRQATARFFVQSLMLTRACRLATPKLRLPVLVLQSGCDAIVNVSRLQGWFKRIGSADKTLKIFTSAAHSLDFEPNPTEYQRLLCDWINMRATRSGVKVGTTL
jgi:acylglycerol lipase